MAHDITFKLPRNIEVELGRNDMEFTVVRNGVLFGRLLMSKGSLEWIPANAQHKRRVRWGKFADWIEAHGRKIPK